MLKITVKENEKVSLKSKDMEMSFYVEKCHGKFSIAFDAPKDVRIISEFASERVKEKKDKSIAEYDELLK